MTLQASRAAALAKYSLKGVDDKFPGTLGTIPCNERIDSPRLRMASRCVPLLQEISKTPKIIDFGPYEHIEHFEPKLPNLANCIRVIVGDCLRLIGD